MSTLAHRLCICWRLDHLRTALSQDSQRRSPLIVRLTVVTLTTLTLCLIAVISGARLRAAPLKIDPPAFLLPGSKLSVQTQCDALVSCQASPNGYRDDITYEGKKVYLVFDVDNQMIVHTTVSVQTYTVGDLIANWGTPTGFARYGHVIDIFWGTRDAYIYSCLLQPDTHIEFLEYDLEPRQGSLWRGFIEARNACASSLYRP
jgi:hypothetical protein